MTELTMIIGWFATFLMVGLPTYFITKKYGRNLKRDWVLFLIPLGFWTPFMFLGYGTGEGIYYDIGSIMGETVIFGTWIFCF